MQMNKHGGKRTSFSVFVRSRGNGIQHFQTLKVENYNNLMVSGRCPAVSAKHTQENTHAYTAQV